MKKKQKGINLDITLKVITILNICFDIIRKMFLK